MSDSPLQRLFLAVPIDDDVRAALAAHLRYHDGGAIPGGHVAPANWHVTMRFLGKSAAAQRDRLVRHLDEELGGGAFAVRFGGLGAFPRPVLAAVVWLGVTTGSERLVEVAAVCEEAAQVAGYLAEERPFHPHLTLARIRPPVDVSHVLASVPPFGAKMRVDRVVLYESLLRRGPPMYQVVEEMLL